jgi:hypothetical protein
MRNEEDPALNPLNTDTLRHQPNNHHMQSSAAVFVRGFRPETLISICNLALGPQEPQIIDPPAKQPRPPENPCALNETLRTTSRNPIPSLTSPRITEQVTQRPVSADDSTSRPTSPSPHSLFRDVLPTPNPLLTIFLRKPQSRLQYPSNFLFRSASTSRRTRRRRTISHILLAARQ